jgi:hypothetical protein
MKVIMILIDGFGVPPEGWRNSVYAEVTSNKFIELFEKHSVPIDATMNISGIPQSATGQTAIFTGLPAAKIVGKHVSAFPGKQLIDLIEQQNIFKSILKLNKKATFANAYVRYTPQELQDKGFASVTTVMSKKSLNEYRNLNHLLSNNAVFHDITRETLKRFEPPEKYKTSKISEIIPEDAAKHLAKFSDQYDFTLYEYFLSDHAGHKNDFPMLTKVLKNFSIFLTKLSELAKDKFSIILVSDHGNCEDMTTKRHTCNPVPFLVYGKMSTGKEKIKSIDKVYDFILEKFK